MQKELKKQNFTLFFIYHKSDESYYLNFEAHLKTENKKIDNKLNFSYYSIHKILPSENRNKFILEKIIRSNIVIFFSSSSAHSDNFTRSWLEKSVERRKKIIAIISKKSRWQGEQGVDVYKKNLIIPPKNQDIYWTDFIEHLTSLCYFSIGQNFQNKKQYEKAKSYYLKVNSTHFPYFTNRDFIRECDNRILENKVKYSLTIEHKINKLELKRLHEKKTKALIAKYEKQLIPESELELRFVYAKRIIIGLLVLLLVSLIRTCTISNKKFDPLDTISTKIIENETPIIIYDSFIFSQPNNNSEEGKEIRQRVSNDYARFISFNISMRFNSKQNKKLKFLWKLIDEDNTVITYKDGPENWTGIKEFTLSNKQKKYSFSSLGIEDKAWLEKGDYKIELWVFYLDNLVLLKNDKFLVK